MYFHQLHCYFKKYHFFCFNEQYFTFLMSKSFTTNHSMKLGGLQRELFIQFLKSIILWQHEVSAEKMCQTGIISHNSAQFEKLNICIVCCITNREILEFISSYFTTYKIRDLFLKYHLLGKSEMSFSFDWDQRADLSNQYKKVT